MRRINRYKINYNERNYVVVRILTFKSFAEKTWPKWLHIHTSSLDQSGQLLSLDKGEHKEHNLSCVRSCLRVKNCLTHSDVNSSIMKNQGTIDTSQFRVRHDYGPFSLSFKDGGECKSPNEALADEQTLPPPTAIWRNKPRKTTC